MSKTTISVELKQHYGWTAYSIDARTLEEAAYLAVRQTHGFLTEDNHRHDAGEREITWGGKQIKFHSVRVFRTGIDPDYPYSEALDGYWFAVEYRAPDSVQ